jgi:hypothetical protein
LYRLLVSGICNEELAPSLSESEGGMTRFEGEGLLDYLTSL